MALLWARCQDLVADCTYGQLIAILIVATARAAEQTQDLCTALSWCRPQFKDACESIVADQLGTPLHWHACMTLTSLVIAAERAVGGPLQYIGGIQNWGQASGKQDMLYRLQHAVFQVSYYAVSARCLVPASVCPVWYFALHDWSPWECLCSMALHADCFWHARVNHGQPMSADKAACHWHCHCWYDTLQVTECPSCLCFCCSRIPRLQIASSLLMQHIASDCLSILFVLAAKQDTKSSDADHSLTNGSAPKPSGHRLRSGELSSSVPFSEASIGSPASLPNGNSDEITVHGWVILSCSPFQTTPFQTSFI